jgi:hypothetical protein
MTREEALEALTSKDVNNPAIMLEALDMAIKALEQEPCEDAISRQAVLDYIHRILNQGTGKKKSFEFIQKYVEKLPSVKQEPNIKALGEDMRICQESITDEKVLIGFNMAVALCNKHLGEREDK